MKANFLYYYQCWYLKRKFIVHEIFDIIPNGKIYLQQDKRYQGSFEP